MKKTLFSIVFAATALTAMAQGWPSDYKGVMLQGFYWDSFSDTKWTNLEANADELSDFFNLIWVPQSGWTGSNSSMGYDDVYWFNQRSAFGTEAELKSMISTFKEKGTGIIADVVINHRGGVSRWSDLPTETSPLDNQTYSMSLSDICADDEYNTQSGAASERNKYGRATGANDTGENFDGSRDLDHTSSNVQKYCKAYTKYLLDYLGYSGFRYDMTKGYSAKYVGIYNANANPTYSVGEYFDTNKNLVTSWIDNTSNGGSKQSAAFDFPQKFLFNSNPSNYYYWYWNDASLATDNTYKRYSVTFVDNHDTYRDSNKFTGSVIAANAWILALPGTPCIFLPHWQEHKSEIAKMIKIRKMLGISNTSASEKVGGSEQYVTAKVTGSEGTLVVIVGSVGTGQSAWNPANNGYKLVLSGNTYAYYVNKDFAGGSYIVDKYSGNYDNSVTVNITPIAGTVVYTTDGSQPSASNGTQMSAAKELTFSKSTILKVGVLKNGSVSDVRTYEYTISAFDSFDITVCVNGDNVGWTSYINFWTWGGDGSHAPSNTTWPGDKTTTQKTENGKQWFYRTYTINGSDDYVSFVFSTGTGSSQTVDVANVRTNSYFEISTAKEDGKYKVSDVTSTVTAIEAPEAATTADSNPYWYSLTGVRYSARPTQQGIYVHNGKKIVVR